ncbi:hypothetical protein ACFU6K_07815 [Kitasatospora sp. NPDC057512]|uniref:hypothetical protein n=1 Tax=Kitasatospora sp. NPDC057512 TaxID=3346154 RepID=UPI003688B709
MGLLAELTTSGWWVILLIAPALLAILVVGIMSMVAITRAPKEDVRHLVVEVAKALPALLPKYRREENRRGSR